VTAVTDAAGADAAGPGPGGPAGGPAATVSTELSHLKAHSKFDLTVPVGSPRL
jgi:hypothetical protein